MLGKGREEKLHSFGEIAVLARTHRALRTVEQCLRKEGIPCLSASDQSFLEAAEVSGTLSFFGAICDGKETAQAEEFLGGRSAFLRAKEKFQPTLRSRPRKILAEWQAYMHIETAAFRELVDAARYADMPEFLEAMRMAEKATFCCQTETLRTEQSGWPPSMVRKVWSFPLCSSTA